MFLLRIYRTDAIWIVLVGFLVFSIDAVFAQSGIRGYVIDQNLQPIPKTSITVSVQSPRANYQLYTDDKGSFNKDLTPGKYQLEVYHLGYERQIMWVDVVEGKVNLLDTILLVNELQQLDEITVQGSRKLIEQKNDRMVINIENSVLATGTTALELLKRAPSVRVDEEDNIHMRGKSDIGILINGKLSYLSAKELTNILKGTPSESIKRIELITSPSAKFDAKGIAGLINIVMKEPMAEPLSGNAHVFGGAGRKERYGLGTTLSGQAGSWRWQGGIEHAYRGEKEYRNFNRFYDNKEDEGHKSLQYSSTDEPLQTQQSRAGLEYVPNHKTTVGMLWTGNFGTYKNFSNGYNDIYDHLDKRSVHTITANTNISRWQAHNVGFSFLHKIGENRELSADWDILYSDYKADQTLRSDILKYGAPNALQEARRNATPSTTYLQVAKLDYQHRWKENVTTEVGWKSSWMKSDNNSLSDTMQNNSWVADAQNSNHFVYNEQIHAAYVNFNMVFGQWGLNTGLRTEHTDANGELKTDGRTVNKRYTQLFPSVSMRYEIADKHQLQLSYSRRINRPDYEDLNPFRYYVDAYVYWEGNPLLQPELANVFELNYTLHRNLFFSLYYTDIKDAMTSVLMQLPEENKTIRSIHNIKGFQNYGVNVNYSLALFSFWSTQWNLNTFENHYFGSYGGERIANRLWSYAVQTTQNYRLPKSWSAEWTAAYESPQSDGVFRQKASGHVSLGVMKKMLNDKLNLKFAVDDVFKTSRYRTNSSVGGVYMDQRIDLDSRVWRVSVGYTFGKKGDGADKKKSEEQQRVRGL